MQLYITLIQLILNQKIPEDDHRLKYSYFYNLRIFDFMILFLTVVHFVLFVIFIFFICILISSSSSEYSLTVQDLSQCDFLLFYSEIDFQIYTYTFVRSCQIYTYIFVRSCQVFAIPVYIFLRSLLSVYLPVFVTISALLVKLFEKCSF